MIRIRFLLWFFTALASAAPVYADDAVSVRASAKDDYTRIVFEFPKAPSYVTDKSASSLTLKFQAAANFKVEGAAPNGMPRITAYSTPDSKTATIGFIGGQDVRHFEIGNKVIVDVRGPEKAPAAKPAEEEKTAEKPPEAKPAETAPAEIKAAEAQPKKADTVVAGKPVAPEVDAPETEPAAVEAKTPAPAADTTDPVTIQITATQTMGLAAFTRFGNLWIVIDSPDYPIPPQVSGPGAKKFGTFERVPLKEATAFRTALPAAGKIHASGEGLVWKIMADGTEPAGKPVAFRHAVDPESHKTSLLWPVPTARRVIDVADPVAGDMLKVVTVDAAKFFTGALQDFPDFQALQSYVGLTVENKVDDLSVKKTPEGIVIESPQGLAVSPESDMLSLRAPEPDKAQGAKAEGEDKEAAKAASPNIFRFDQWQMGNAKSVEDNRRILMAGMTGKTPQGRAQDLMTLAKMELSYGRGPEAVGYLDLAGQFVPELLTNPEFLALHGAASAQSGEYETALRDFSHEALKNAPEIAPWKAYALASLEDWKQAADILPADFGALAQYPDPVRIPLSLTLAEVALRDGDLKKADDLLKLPVKDEKQKLILPYKAAFDYMKAEAARQRGNTEETEKLWTALKNGRDDLYRAKAGLALTGLQLEKKELKPAEAIDRLEGLRYAWRGDELETSINYKLGQMYVQNNEPIKGLALLRQAAALSPASEQAKKINAEMVTTFNNLFEPNRIKDINPIDAISLYNEFSNLSPPGSGNDRIVRQLADRLVDADLLPRAAGLLQAQVDSGKLAGADGAATALRLASIYIQDNKPEKGIAALNKATAFINDAKLSEPSLTRQIALLKAEALSEQKKPEEAFTVLAGLEQTQEVLKLKADIAWSNKRWQDAADALESLVKVGNISAGRPANEENASLLLNWAVALYLADNRYVLANLRELYTTAMAATPKAKQFEVVTRPRQSSLIADRDSINSIIEETEIFKGFVDSTRARNNAANQPAGSAQNIAPVPQPRAPETAGAATPPPAAAPAAGTETQAE